MSESPLHGILTVETLLEMADDGSFLRGEGYCENGQVISLTDHGASVTAKVKGSELYDVALWEADGDLEYSTPIAKPPSFSARSKR